MHTMKEKLIRFMSGRYGVDQLSKFMNVLVFVFLVLGIFFPKGSWLLAAMILIVCCYFRIFSKKTEKRAKENQLYLQLYNNAAEFFKKQKYYINQRKTHHIYACPSCRQKIRIPRGKGKISIHCPKCGNDFIKKS